MDDEALFNHQPEEGEEVVRKLLNAMTETVTNYHPDVRRTSGSIEGLIQGTACFPGGSGLWRGESNGGPLPKHFPKDPVMFVAHNFDSERGYALSLARQGEAQGEFWQRLLGIVEAAGLSPQECFFTNALMGLKPGKAEGEMPSVAGYRDQCRRLLERQVEIVRPRAIVALGVKAARHLVSLDQSRCFEAKHPKDWYFRELATRDQRLRAEGSRVAEFLAGLTGNQPKAPLSIQMDRQQQHSHRSPTEMNISTERQTDSMTTDSALSETDRWGFRFNTRSSFLMQTLEEGGRSKETIRSEFVQRYPDSAGKSTFSVFFADLIRPFGSASGSRCLRILADEKGHLYLEPERARKVKDVVRAGILSEINALEGTFPKRNQSAIDTIVEKYRAPRQ